MGVRLTVTLLGVPGGVVALEGGVMVQVSASVMFVALFGAVAGEKIVKFGVTLWTNERPTESVHACRGGKGRAARGTLKARWDDFGG